MTLSCSYYYQPSPPFLPLPPPPISLPSPCLSPLSPSPPHICSASLCVLHLSGQSGLPAARLVGEEEDTEKPSTSLSASRLTFALSTGLRRVSVKHLASLTLINMAAQVSQ